jgi:hypothetical protein
VWAFKFCQIIWCVQPVVGMLGLAFAALLGWCCLQHAHTAPLALPLRIALSKRLARERVASVVADACWDLFRTEFASFSISLGCCASCMQRLQMSAGLLCISCCPSSWCTVALRCTSRVTVVDRIFKQSMFNKVGMFACLRCSKFSRRMPLLMLVTDHPVADCCSTSPS